MLATTLAIGVAAAAVVEEAMLDEVVVLVVVDQLVVVHLHLIMVETTAIICLDTATMHLQHRTEAVPVPVPVVLRAAEVVELLPLENRKMQEPVTNTAVVHMLLLIVMNTMIEMVEVLNAIILEILVHSNNTASSNKNTMAEAAVAVAVAGIVVAAVEEVVVEATVGMIAKSTIRGIIKGEEEVEEEVDEEEGEVIVVGGVVAVAIKFKVSDSCMSLEIELINDEGVLLHAVTSLYCILLIKR